MIDPVVSVSLRCLLAAVFVAAAWHKVSDHARFRAVLRAYRVIPGSLSDVVSWSVPLVEFLVAGGLASPSYRIAAGAAAGVLTLYSAAIAFNLARGRRDIDCGCFGPAARVPLSGSLLARNAVLVSGALLASAPLRDRPLVWVDGLTVVLLVLVTALLWVSFWRLRQVAGQRRPS
ncbi:MAG: MauE/DoxX family redox-associated membrane protein [Polyangiales bacterium]